jgi:hypothetical protein
MPDAAFRVASQTVALAAAHFAAGHFATGHLHRAGHSA